MARLAAFRPPFSRAAGQPTPSMALTAHVVVGYENYMYVNTVRRPAFDFSRFFGFSRARGRGGVC